MDDLLCPKYRTVLFTPQPSPFRPICRYGESEGLLSKVFKSAEALGGAIVFFDELDSLGGNRERGDVHEVCERTRHKVWMCIIGEYWDLDDLTHWVAIISRHNLLVVATAEDTRKLLLRSKGLP